MRKLRDYQSGVFDACIEHFRSKDGDKPAIIDCSVGAGKTAIAAFLTKHTADKGGRVLVLARQSDLIMQDGAFIESVGIRVSYYSAGLGAKQASHNVVAATEGSIVRALDTVFARWRPDLIILDECHQLAHDDVETMMMRTILHFKEKNPKCRVLGMTGSPFRNNESIIGDFWSKCLAQISTETLIHAGWLVSPVFGYPLESDNEFHFESIADDWTEEQLDHFRENDPTKTQRIMAEVVQRTKDMLGVLICCQSKKHMEEVATVLPEGSWVIVVDDTPNREAILEKCRTGEYRYCIQLALLTTGVDVSYWQTIVYLRPVGSIVLLIQSLGRVLRLHVDDDIDMGALDADGRKLQIGASQKPFAMVLDYAGVMDRLGELYENPLLAQAQLEKSKRQGSTIYCPKCNAENSDKARRCVGEDHMGVRCDHYWISQDCRSCGAKNDVTARDCRICGEMLLDPNERLLHKAYTDSELVPVSKMEMDKTKNGGILIRFILEGEKPDHGWPVEYFAPGGSETARRVWYNQIIKVHVRGSQFQSKLYMMRNVDAILKMRAMFSKPTHIAYRINDKGKFVIGRRRFDGGWGGEAEVIEAGK